MSILRILLVSVFVFLFASTLFTQISFAQTSLYKYPTASQSQTDGIVAPPEFRARVAPLPPGVLAKMADVYSPRRIDLALASNDADCLVIRTYQVKRDNPNSDLTRAVGYTECQPAAQYQMKIAVESREIAPR